MKSGSRALGVTESSPGATRAPTNDADDAHFSTDPSPESVLCNAVVRVDRVVNGLAFRTCAVGGNGATDAIASLYDSLDHEDVRYPLVSGIAPAWLNLVDINRLTAALDRPVLSVSFEESEGLEPTLTEQFSGTALDRRLATRRVAPSRRPVEVNGEMVFVRAAGCDSDEAVQVVRGFTPTGGRPGSIRMARVTTRAARRFAGD